MRTNWSVCWPGIPLCLLLLSGICCGGDDSAGGEFADLVAAGKLAVTVQQATLTSSDPSTARLKVQLALSPSSTDLVADGNQITLDQMSVINQTSGEDYGQVFPDDGNARIGEVSCQPPQPLVLSEQQPEVSCGFTVEPPNTIGKVALTFVVPGRIGPLSAD